MSYDLLKHMVSMKTGSPPFRRAFKGLVHWWLPGNGALAQPFRYGWCRCRSVTKMLWKFDQLVQDREFETEGETVSYHFDTP